MRDCFPLKSPFHVPKNEKRQCYQQQLTDRQTDTETQTDMKKTGGTRNNMQHLSTNTRPYTRAKVACGWAGAIKSKVLQTDRRTDRQTDREWVVVACTRL